MLLTASCGFSICPRSRSRSRSRSASTLELVRDLTGSATWVAHAIFCIRCTLETPSTPYTVRKVWRVLRTSPSLSSTHSHFLLSFNSILSVLYVHERDEESRCTVSVRTPGPLPLRPTAYRYRCRQSRNNGGCGIVFQCAGQSLRSALNTRASRHKAVTRIYPATYGLYPTTPQNCLRFA